MDIFSILINNLIPLYIVVILGFLGAYLLDISPRNISRFVIYLVSPFIIFEASMRIDFTLQNFIQPLLYSTVCLVMTGIAFLFGKMFLPNYQVNLFSVASSTKNTGYVGIPLVLVLFPPEIANAYIIIIIGGLLLDVSLNIYLLARHESTPLDSIKKLLSMPVLYAFGLGALLNGMDYEIPSTLDHMFVAFKGTLIILGLAIIGLSIGQLSKFEMQYKFVLSCLIIQIFIWPIITYGLLWLDYNSFGLVPSEYHILFLFIAFTPIAANVTAYANEFNIMPANAATIVLLSTILAIIVIPIGLYLTPNLLVGLNPLSVAY